MEKANQEKPRRVYLVNEDAADAFNRSVNELMVERIKHERAKFLTPKNIHHFRHGKSWVQPSSPQIDHGEMHAHSVETATRFEDIVAHDLNLIERLVTQISNSLHSQFMAMMFQTVSDACDQSGNVVDAKAEGGIEDAFLRMIEKIQFSADPDGKVNFPQIHAGPEMAEALRRLDQDATPEFKTKLEELTKKRIEEALENEVKRKARFLQYGEEQ